MPVDRVMVVGGQSALADAIRIHLHAHRRDILVESVTSGAPALERIERGFTGVVILDVGLAPLSGMALLREARKARTSLPIVIAMSPFRYGLAIEALNAGAHAIMSKPTKREECIAIVQAALRVNRLARTVEANRISLQRCVRRFKSLASLLGSTLDAAPRTSSTSDALAFTATLLGFAETRLNRSHEHLLAAQGEARLRGWLRAGEHAEDLVPVSCYVR